MRRGLEDIAQRRLLAIIYRRNGGLIGIAKKLGISSQLALFWRTQGYVPIKRITKASKVLKVSPYALNYKGYTDFSGENLSWKKVVLECELTKEEKSFVLET
jgi:hypothetical protein